MAVTPIVVAMVIMMVVIVVVAPPMPVAVPVPVVVVVPVPCPRVEDDGARPRSAMPSLVVLAAEQQERCESQSHNAQSLAHLSPPSCDGSVLRARRCRHFVPIVT